MKFGNTAPEWVKIEARNNGWLESLLTGTSEDVVDKNNCSRINCYWDVSYDGMDTEI